MASPLCEFKKLNDLVSLYRPAAHDNSANHKLTSSPRTLIVICSWVGAAAKHIAKYTSGYQERFQDATILLVQSKVSSMIIRSDISPAYEVLDSFVDCQGETKDDGKASMVLHTFSNGGANSAIWLATHLQSKQQRLPLAKLILDCCPGQPEIAAIARAITLSLPDQYLVRTIGSLFVYFFVVLLMLPVHVLRLEDTITRIRRTLNDPKSFPKSTPRLYLYSKADSMVRYQDVHEHAQDARRSGYESVHEEVFESAAHCALSKEDADLYWKMVSEW